jgi:hypothetical protein
MVQKSDSARWRCYGCPTGLRVIATGDSNPAWRKRIHVCYGFDPAARAASLPGIAVGGDAKAGIASLPANVQLGVGRNGTDAYTSARTNDHWRYRVALGAEVNVSSGFKRFSITTASCGTHGRERWRIWESRGPMPCKREPRRARLAMPPASVLSPLTKTSSHSGKRPTVTSLFSSKPKRSTRSCSEPSRGRPSCQHLKRFSRLCTLQREFCSRCNVKLAS